MPAASLQHLGRPTLQDSDNRRTRLVALANQQTTQEAAFLVNLRHPLLLSALLSQPNLGLALVIPPAASLAQNLRQVAASLDKTTQFRRLSKAVASSVLQVEPREASVQELGQGLVPEVVYLVATTNNSSNNSQSRFHSVGQLPPLEVLGRATLVSAIPTILQTIPVVAYSVILAKTTLLLGKLNSSQLKQTRSAALVLKIKPRLIIHRPSEALVPSSNKSRSQADCLADKMPPTLGEVACLGPRTRTISNRLLQEVFLGIITTTISRPETRFSRQSQLRRVVAFSERPIQPIQIKAVAFSGVLATTITMPTRISRIKLAACLVPPIINSKSQVYLAILMETQVVGCSATLTITTNSPRAVASSARAIKSSNSSKVEVSSATSTTTRVQAFLAIPRYNSSSQML